ncbi:MAG: SpoIIE family protein phosphatase [bacterium]|nr:SpoIIE family protein phosphatase [bacterium]
MTIAEQTAAIEDLEARLATQKAQLGDLATMGTVITAILEIDAVLSVTMDMAIRLVDGEVGLILIEEEGELRPKVTWGVSESFVKSLLYEDGLDLSTYCFEKRETIFLSDLEIVSSEGIVLDSVVACPIQTRERCLGVMIIINKAGGGSYTTEDREVLGMLLNFVAVAVENAELVKDKLRQQKIAQEMAIARQVQETILPQDIDDIAGIEIGAVYFPAREVGGDFYEILKLDGRRFMAIIGDVSNKGVPAALVMSACSAVIKSVLAANPDISVSKLAETVNDLMSREIIKDREMFVTLFFSSFDLEARRLTFCNAGHMPGLFWNDRQKRIEELADGGPILGQFEGIDYKQGQRSLDSDDRLFLFTDGLTEAMDADENLFGRERAEQVFSAEIGAPPKEFCLKVKEWVDAFTKDGSEENQDDFTILQVKVDKI